MSDVIKSLTAKIGADTSDFIKEMKKVDREINLTKKTASELQKGLELKFNSKNFQVAQKQVQKALDETSAKADAIRQHLAKLEESGQIDSSSYQKLQLELAKAENSAVSLGKQLKSLNELQLSETSSKVDEIGNKISSLGKKLGKLSVASAGVLTGLGALAKSTVSYAAGLEEEAKRVGISASALQEWLYVATQCDVQSSDLEKSITKIRSAYTDLSTGATSSQSEMLSSLGIIAGQYSNNEEVFNAVVRQLMLIEDETLKVSYANELFGDELATKLLPLLNTSTEEITAFQKEFSNMSGLSDEQVAALSKLDDTLYKLKTQFKNLGMQIGASFQPLLEKIASIVDEKVVPAVEKLVKWFSGLSDSQQAALVGGLALMAILSPMLLLVGKLTESIGGMIGILKGIPPILTLIQTHPIIAAITSVIALIAILYAKNESFRKSLNSLLSTLGSLLSNALKPVVSTLMTLFKLLMPIIDIVANVLAPVIQMTEILLQPIVKLLEWMSNAIDKILGGIKKAAGWFGIDLGGNEDSSSNLPTTYTPVIDTIDYSSLLGSSSPVYNNSSTSSNDTYNITVNVDSNEYLDTDELVSTISKKLAIKAQSRS